MERAARQSTVLITVTGRDKPGVTSALMATLAEHGCELLDVEQVVIRGRLTLSALIARPAAPGALIDAVEDAMTTSGMDVDIEIGTDPVGSSQHSTHAVVLLGKPLTAEALSRVSGWLASHRANIDTIRGIADYPVTGIELAVTARDASGRRISGIRQGLAELSNELGVDIAFERGGLARRSQRLVVFDVDSTLVQGEVIEMLAAHAGKEADVAAVTERAMRGELDFAESLRERVKALEGLDQSVLDATAEAVVLTPGARTTLRTLKRLGYRVGVVSGGFVQVIDRFAADLDLDFVLANTLEIEDGKLTGRVTGEIVDRAGKARALKNFAARENIPLEQTVAVGDGANDIDMLNVSGLGIAFNAKPVLKEVADASVNYPFLDSVLFMMGITRSEIEAADAHDRIADRTEQSAPAVP